jgi:hypothetical protein
MHSTVLLLALVVPADTPDWTPPGLTRDERLMLELQKPL